MPIVHMTPSGSQSELRPATSGIASPSSDVQGCQVWSYCDATPQSYGDSKIYLWGVLELSHTLQRACFIGQPARL